jgi:hypothetical protein
VLGAYLIGEPGSGKSTLLATVTADAYEVEWRTKPFAHALYYGQDGRTRAAQIGGWHERFPGTDRLSMSVQPKAIEWLLSAPAPVVFGEGDRLATTGFLAALADACDDWWLFYLATPEATAAERRAERGGGQNETWLAGRRTKVRRLVEAHQDRLVTIDGAEPVAVLADALRQWPAFAWSLPL